MLKTHGAVSEPVARAMAEAARAKTGATLAIAVTGIAGPGGGYPDKPCGTVHMACASSTGETQHKLWQFGDPGRDIVREQTAAEALKMLLAGMNSATSS